MTYASAQTVLSLDESETASESLSDELVSLVLTAEQSEGDTLVGELWWTGQQMQNINLIDAIFAEDQGSSGEPGKVDVKINLLSGQKFVKTDGMYAYTLGENDQPMPMECVTVESFNGKEKDKTSAIRLIFEEPGSAGEHYVYPHVYFSTTIGVIDPGISVRRRPL